MQTVFPLFFIVQFLINSVKTFATKTAISSTKMFKIYENCEK